jgi:hypothetical protein
MVHLTDDVADVHGTSDSRERAALQAENDQLRARLSEYEDAVHQASIVCKAAADGDLEQRVLHIRTGTDTGDMLHNLNHLLDMTDAFVREAGAALEHAARWRSTAHERAALQAGARRFAMTIARALELGLLVEHGGAMRDETATMASREACRCLRRGGIDLIQDEEGA